MTTTTDWQLMRGRIITLPATDSPAAACYDDDTIAELLGGIQG